MLLFNPFTKSFAIDISDLRLRLMYLRPRGKGVRVASFNEMVVPAGYILDGEIREEEKVSKLISQLIATAQGSKIKTRYVVASLPERKTFFKVFEIPLVPEKEEPGTIRWGIEQNIPVTMSEISYDWQILKRDESRGKSLVAVAVISQDITRSYVSTLTKAKLTPVVLETESSAIARSVVDETSSRDGLILIDLGASRTSLILIVGSAIYYSSTVDLSGHEMTQTVARKLNLNPEQAEKAKHICGLDEKKGRGVIRTALLPLFERLLSKVNEIQSFYQNSLQKKEPLRIVLCGGVSQMAGLETYLSKKFPLPVSIGNPLSQLTNSNALKVLPKNKVLSYTTVIGLGLRPILSPKQMIQ